MDIKVATLNVRGLNNNNKCNVIFSWVKELYDICLVQESYCTLANSDKFKRGWKGEILHSYSNSTHSRSVSILFNRKLDYTVLNSHTDNDGRLILANLKINNNEFTLVNIYAPNSEAERIAFFNKMKEFIKVHAVNKSKLIIGGDFNCVLEFGVLCCLTTTGLRKDIRHQIRRLYSHKITYVHYNYILSSHLLSHFRIYLPQVIVVLV